MAYNTFSPMITKNMILCLDSTNIKSYNDLSATWYDLTSYSNHCQIFNGPSFNRTLYFDGADDYCSFTYNELFNFSDSDFTIECYFRPDSFSSFNNLISKDTYGINFDWSMTIVSDNSIYFYTQGTSVFVNYDLPYSLNNETWYHCVITGEYDSIATKSNVSIYLNSEFLKTDSFFVSNDSTDECTIGCFSWNNPNSFFNGDIATIRLYRYKFSDNDIINNYNVLKNRFV